MTPPTATNGTRRRAECPVCGRPFLVRADGLLRRHDDGVRHYVCTGSYVDCTSEGTAT